MPAGRPRLPPGQKHRKVLISLHPKFLIYVEQIATESGISRSTAFQKIIEFHKKHKDMCIYD